jgi:HAD superfamily hydrolase (TIGR01509 family)
MKIEALLFDLGKVLIDFDFEIGLRSMLASCLTPRDKFEAVLWDEKWMRRYERGEISTEDFHKYLCDSASLNMDLARFQETWSSIFLPDPIVSEDILLALKANYPLILVSNTNHGHAEFIRDKYNIFNHFDHLIFSHEVGSLKPDRRIFESAIAASGRSPGNLFFTDDREENVLAAREMGMHAHRFVSEPLLVEALGEFGVQVDVRNT